MSMFQGYHHIGLAVPNTARSLSFYEAIGGREVYRFPIGDQFAYLVDLGGGAVIEILPFGQGGEEKEARFAHIALNCKDVYAAYDLLLKAGATVKSEIREGALMGEPPMPMTNCFLYGPDGEQIELFHVK